MISFKSLFALFLLIRLYRTFLFKQKLIHWPTQILVLKVLELI